MKYALLPCFNCRELPTWEKIDRETWLTHKQGPCPFGWMIHKRTRERSVKFWNNEQTEKAKHPTTQSND